eukprot:CAMPEP_0171498648 /NCGR_PEP_ID=MMETSP0958-20121227/7972_1 /TAXON_ID=87120 /ORGANISM="Aurantiochytrium limacinum, Strain ATCCMYA-1381" /LENGTH=254 /DNA_ID=CAMNT_0012033081 /DNA_START=397 /DNA_END=1158 /DNA_ORIENTATION=-
MSLTKGLALLGLAGGAAAMLTELRDAATEPASGLSKPVDRKRTILITGAASGIGLNTAQLFLAKGWFVGAFDVNAEGLEKAFKGRSPQSVYTATLDVCDPEACKEALKNFLEAAPGNALDVLFNNAGILTIDEFERIPLERQQKIIDVNCSGVINMTMAALPSLKATRGCIVSMASASSVGGFPFHVTYAASKAFVYSFTEGLRTELAQHGVRVCDVSVLYVNTSMVNSQQYDSWNFLNRDTYISPALVAGTVW